jgi:hypothetical protein
MMVSLDAQQSQWAAESAPAALARPHDLKRLNNIKTNQKIHR